MPEFRLKIDYTQVVNGDTHYHLHLLAPRGDAWSVCGILLLHEEEWERFRLICEVVGIEISAHTTEAAATH